MGVDVPIMEWAAEEGVDDDIIRERLVKETDEMMAKKAVYLWLPRTMRNIEKAGVAANHRYQMARNIC